MNGAMKGRKKGSDAFETWAWLQNHLDKTQPSRFGMETPCWEWTGPRERKGYGRLDVQKRPILTHRLAWWASRGVPAGENLRVLHRCDNPPCCNPDHLWLGSYGDNNADRDAKGRSAAGVKIRENHPLNRLTPETVVEIRQAHAAGISYVDIADAHGVSPTTVRNAAAHKTWKYVKDDGFIERS